MVQETIAQTYPPDDIGWESAYERAKAGNADAIMSYCFTDESRRPIAAGELHERWNALAEKTLRLHIRGPRGFAKTTWLQAYVLGVLGTNPNAIIKYITGEPDLALSFVDAVEQHIQHNDRLREIFPDLQPNADGDWSKHRATVRRSVISKEASLTGWGVLQGHTGGRATHLLFDDVVNWRNSAGNPAMIPKVKDTFKRTWIPFLIPGGQIMYLDTPWGNADLGADIHADPDWIHWEKPALLPGDVPLWPERFPKEVLDQIRRDLKSEAVWAQQFMIQPFALSETTFPHDLVDAIFDDYCLVPRWEPGWLIVGGVDLASSLSEEASFTVCISAFVKPSGERILVDMWREHIQPVPTWERLKVDWQMLRHHNLLVENNAYQEAAVDYLNRTCPEASQAIHGFTTGKQKADPELGIPGMRARLALWTVPMGGRSHDLDCQCPRCQLKAELKAYPFGAHTDCVMALWFADTAAEQVLRADLTHTKAAVSDSRRPVGAARYVGGPAVGGRRTPR